VTEVPFLCSYPVWGDGRLMNESANAKNHQGTG
jgi:hypothetical protein